MEDHTFRHYDMYTHKVYVRVRKVESPRAVEEAEGEEEEAGQATIHTLQQQVQAHMENTESNKGLPIAWREFLDLNVPKFSEMLNKWYGTSDGAKLRYPGLIGDSKRIIDVAPSDEMPLPTSINQVNLAAHERLVQSKRQMAYDYRLQLYNESQGIPTVLHSKAKRYLKKHNQQVVDAPPLTTTNPTPQVPAIPLRAQPIGFLPSNTGGLITEDKRRIA